MVIVSDRSVITENSKKREKLAEEQVYKTEDEAKDDIARLIKLNDFEGVKMRIAQIYKEKAAVD